MNRQPDQILDELLVIRAQGGERSAIGMLVERWQHRLIGHVRAMINDEQAAADIVQDSWLAIFKGIRRLRDPATFPGWAIRIAHRQAVDWIRRQKRERKHQERLHENSNQNTSDPDAVNNEDALTNLRIAITQLTPQQRSLVRLFYHEQLPLAEISKITRTPVGTLKYRLFKLRQKLKTILEKESESDEVLKH